MSDTEVFSSHFTDVVPLISIDESATFLVGFYVCEEYLRTLESHELNLSSLTDCSSLTIMVVSYVYVSLPF